jgi:integrase
MDTSGNIPDRTSDPTFAEAWALWLAFRCRGTRPLRASTRADYESIHRKHLGPALDSVALTAIDGSLVARLTIELSDAGISPKRVSNVLVPLRACLRWHHRMGTMPRDPSAWFDPPSRAADERRILTPAQIERLLEALPERHRAMVAFAAYTGVRAGELRALTWADLDLERRAARINKTLYRNRPQRSTKSGRDRVVPIPRHVCRLLIEHRTRSDASEIGLVFPGADGRPLDLDTFRARVFKPAVTQAGLPPGTRIHDLRHTSASLYLQSGATVREVMDIHGWSQLQTALRYLHTGDNLDAAAERLSAARDASLSSSATSRDHDASPGPAFGREAR